MVEDWGWSASQVGGVGRCIQLHKLQCCISGQGGGALVLLDGCVLQPTPRALWTMWFSILPSGSTTCISSLTGSMISPSKALLSIFHMHLFFSAPTGRMDMALGLRIVIASPRHPQSNHPADRHPSLPLAVTPPPPPSFSFNRQHGHGARPAHHGDPHSQRGQPVQLQRH
jgi:hypothetical protein